MKLYYTIGVRIEGQPFIGVWNSTTSTYVLAFCGIVKDLLSAALAGKFPESHPEPVIVAPIARGYIGLIHILNPSECLPIVEAVVRRYRLASITEIALAAPFAEKYQHYSGRDFGPFEGYREEVEKLKTVLRQQHRPDQNVLPPVKR